MLTEGAVRVTAGPGTGKTRALTARFCHLVANIGVNPMNILCATFTNRAAAEMKSRIRAALGDMDLGYISTVHSFCLKLLKEDIHRLGFPKNFTVLDTSDQKTLLNKIYADMNLTLRDFTVKQALDDILEARKLEAGSYIENIHLLDNEVLRQQFIEAKDFKDEIFFRYLYEQKKSFAVDFNDLINFAYYLLMTFEDVRDKWQKRMEYVMIDEFQDMSAKQYKLAALLAGYHKNLFIVGDPDQTIYSWLGSNVELFNKFTERHQGAKSLQLVRNYRSTPQILLAASNVINHNPFRLEYAPCAERPDGVKPVFYRAHNGRLEAQWIAGQIIELLAAAGRAPSEVAVIYRAHHQSRNIEEAFIKLKLPYRLFSGTEFYKRAEIKDMVCYLRMLTSADDAAFLRTIAVPKRKMGKKRLAVLVELAEGSGGLTLYQTLKENLGHEAFKFTEAAAYIRAIEMVKGDLGKLNLGDILQKLMDLSGYESYLRLQGDQDRLDNASELKRAIVAFGQDEEATVQDFLNQAALFSNIDHDGSGSTVKLMTIHGAKGLEFPVVFLCGLSEGQLPSRLAKTQDELAEERRLCYVAMTRAKERLFLTESAEIGHDGLFKVTSRFVLEAGPQAVDFLTPPQSGSYMQPAPDLGPAPTPVWGVGRKVTHEFFGRGTIVEVKLLQEAYLVDFESLPTPRSIRFKAHLTPLD
jgi:DNA helicase-2/ATP-dependent DNA helicase PcrA